MAATPEQNEEMISLLEIAVSEPDPILARVALELYMDIWGETNAIAPFVFRDPY